MQNLTRIDEDNFIGMNDKYPSHLLPQGVFQLLQNALVADNRIEKRPGTDNVADSLGSFAIFGGSAYEPSGASKRQIVLRNGSSNAQLYSWDGSGSFSAIGSANITASTAMNFIQASNRLFGFTGTEVVDVDSALTVTRNRAGVPTAKFGIWFHNFLFTANTSSNPSRLEWSALGNPISFSGTDYFDVNPNDGDEITGLAVLNDELFVFKRNTIWSITGWSGATFTATTVAGQNTNSKIYGYGCVSHQSIVNTGKDLYYLSFLGGTPHIRSFRQTQFAQVLEEGIVSWDIENTLDGVNKSQLAKCAGVYDGKYIYWAIPNGSSTTNDLVLVFDPEKKKRSSLGIHRSWVKWKGVTPSQYFTSTISGRTKVYFCDATTGGFVYEQGVSTYSDNGTAIEMDVRTREYMLSPVARTKWKYLFFRHGTGISTTMSLRARLQKAASYTEQESIPLQGSSPGLGIFQLDNSVLGGADIGVWRTNFIKLTGDILGVQFYESSTKFLQLFDFHILGFKKGLRDRKV